METYEELESKYRLALNQLEKQAEEMASLRNEKLEVKKAVAVLMLDFKALRNKHEQEVKAHSTAEATIAELKVKFESDRSLLANQLTLAGEKYSSLEKQNALLSEKLKAESEAVTREANASSELKHLLAASESAMAELRAKVELERVKERELDQLKDQLGASMAKVKELDATILCLRGELKDYKMKQQQQQQQMMPPQTRPRVSAQVLQAELDSVIILGSLLFSRTSTTLTNTTTSTTTTTTTAAPATSWAPLA